MANVGVQKVNGNDSGNLPILDELARRFEGIRQRAFDLFLDRGRKDGNELEDWFRAEREMFGSQVAELTDKGDSFEVQMAFPGFDAKDIDVTATPDQVVVHAESKQDKKSDTGKVLWSEFKSSDVCRSISAPDKIDPDKVTASLDKGLLRITAPKAAQNTPMAVAVKAA
jgi:HSP20 family protein